MQFEHCFENHRAHLHAVALRMLGSVHDAEDVVQQTWLKAAAADLSDVHNPAGWLTTVLSRECLDMLRRRRSEVPLEDDPLVWDDPGDLVGSVGAAMVVMLDRLTPAQRVAFVLHDVFGVPFADVAAALGTTPAAAKKLASRARRAVAGAELTGTVDREHLRLAEAFLAASREGDIGTLVEVLAPDVVRHVDAILVPPGVATEVRGARAVAEETRVFAARARAAVVVVVDGEPVVAIVVDGRVRILIRLAFAARRITAIDIAGPPFDSAGFESPVEE